MVTKNCKFEDFKKYSIVLESVVGIILILSVWKVSGLRFENNDDFIIQGLLSGYFTGDRRVYAIFQYNHYLINIILASLYKVIPRMPWYGLLLVAVHYLCFLFPINAICSRTKCFIEYICIAVFFSTVYMGEWYLHARIQYTSTAELCAIMGYVCYAFCKNKAQQYMYFCILEILAFCLRPNAMLLMIPMGLCIMLLLVDDHKLYLKKKSLKELTFGISFLILLVCIGKVSMVLPTIDREFRLANECNESRMQMFDYTGVPKYEEIYDLLDENVTEEKLEAFKNYLILEWDCSDGNLQRLEEYTKSKVVHPKVLEVLKMSFDILFKNKFCKISAVILPMLVATLLGIVISKKYWMFVQVFVFHIAATVSLGWLVYNGRIPGRVIYPIVFAEIVYLMCVIVKTLTITEEEHELRTAKNVVKVVTVVIALFFSGISVKEQYRFIKDNTLAEKLLSEQFDTVINYCNKNQDGIYIVSHEFYLYTSVSVFKKYDTGNYILSGGWYSLLPESLEYVKEYLGQDKKCYFIISEDTQQFVIDAKLNYLEQYFGEKSEEADEFITSTGVLCKVYCVRK
jgi:hypothetical protein